MKTILPEALDDRVRLGQRIYRLRPSVANVLRALDALRSDRLILPDRIRLAVWHLYRFPRPRPTQAAVEAAFALLNEPPAYPSNDNHPQTLDLQQDAAMITAAFRQQYGLDPQSIARLDWREFLALLGGITDATMLGEIERIRSTKPPRRTANNGEQIRELQRLKMIYRIRRPAQTHSFEDGMKRLAIMLADMAEVKTTDEVRDRPEPDQSGISDTSDRPVG